jgi:hypothetical protein
VAAKRFPAVAMCVACLGVTIYLPLRVRAGLS